MMTITWTETMKSTTLTVDGVAVGNIWYHADNEAFYAYQDRSGEDQFVGSTPARVEATIADWNSAE